MRYTLIMLALLGTGCATNDALFAQYERPCPTSASRPVPSIAQALVVTGVAETVSADLIGFEPAVFFDLASAELDSRAQATLTRVVALLGSRDDVHLFLRAQTDWRGSEAVNDALATRRLASVRGAFLDAGMAAARIRGAAIGERETEDDARPPVMDAARRVDIEFVDRHGRPLPIHLAAGGVRE